MTITNIVINNLNDDFSQILSRIKLVKEYNLQCNNLKEILEEKEKSDELIKKTLEEHKIIIENYLNNLEETFNIDDLNELLNILFEKNNIIKKK